MLSYRDSIRIAAELHGWTWHEEDGVMVLTDGHSTCRHNLGGSAFAEYVARLERDDVHLGEVRAYEEEARRNHEREEYARDFYLANHREREEVR